MSEKVPVGPPVRSETPPVLPPLMSERPPVGPPVRLLSDPGPAVSRLLASLATGPSGVATPPEQPQEFQVRRCCPLPQDPQVLPHRLAVREREISESAAPVVCPYNRSMLQVGQRRLQDSFIGPKETCCYTFGPSNWAAQVHI